MPKTFAGRLRHYRRRAFLTQAQLGDRVGVAGKTIGFWERGIAEPRGSSLQRLCEALGIRYEDLYPLESEEEEPAA